MGSLPVRLVCRHAAGGRRCASALPLQAPTLSRPSSHAPPPAGTHPPPLPSPPRQALDYQFVPLPHRLPPRHRVRHRRDVGQRVEVWLLGQPQQKVKVGVPQLGGAALGGGQKLAQFLIACGKR